MLCLCQSQSTTATLALASSTAMSTGRERERGKILSNVQVCQWSQTVKDTLRKWGYGIAQFSAYTHTNRGLIRVNSARLPSPPFFLSSCFPPPILVHSSHAFDARCIMLFMVDEQMWQFEFGRLGKKLTDIPSYSASQRCLKEVAQGGCIQFPCPHPRTKEGKGKKGKLVRVTMRDTFPNCVSVFFGFWERTTHEPGTYNSNRDVRGSKMPAWSVVMLLYDISLRHSLLLSHTP